MGDLFLDVGVVMDEIKVYEDGKISVFKVGTRIRMTKDIILRYEELEELDTFVEAGTEGVIIELCPRIGIKFDLPQSVFTKEFFLQDSLDITDIVELVKESHLRLVKN